MTELLHRELSDKVPGCAFSVRNILGPGLLKSAYREVVWPERLV